MEDLQNRNGRKYGRKVNKIIRMFCLYERNKRESERGLYEIFKEMIHHAEAA
jgi:hypothetical protein